MASSNLTNIYAVDSFNEAMINETTYKSALLNSGILEEDGEVAQFIAQGHGRKVTNIGYNDIPDPVSGGNVAQGGTHNPGYTDDSGTDLVPNSASTYQYDMVKCIPAYALGQKEIVKTCSFLADPITALNGKMAGYWARFFDMYGVAQLNGIFADNVANDAGDMVAGDGTTAVDADLMIDTMQTMGDAAEYGMGTWIMNSKVVSALRKAQLIDSIPSAENAAVNFDYFQGVRVITSDQGQSSGGTAVSTFCMPGAMTLARSTQNIIPSETYRLPLQGVGAGEEMLITRQQFAMGTKGFSWLDAIVSGSVASGAIGGVGGTELWPSIADQAQVTNWNRVVDRKNVKLAFMHTSETV